MKTWKILDDNGVPKDSQKSTLTCKCGTEAELPVIGLAIAQVGMGLVFDVGGHKMPKVIQCRKCGRCFELEGGE